MASVYGVQRVQAGVVETKILETSRVYVYFVTLSQLLGSPSGTSYVLSLLGYVDTGNSFSKTLYKVVRRSLRTPRSEVNGISVD